MSGYPQPTTRKVLYADPLMRSGLEKRIVCQECGAEVGTTHKDTCTVPRDAHTDSEGER